MDPKGRNWKKSLPLMAILTKFDIVEYLHGKIQSNVKVSVSQRIVPYLIKLLVHKKKYLFKS